jgi:hypothetical protein
LDCQIGEFTKCRFRSQTFSRTPFGQSLIIVFHPSSFTLIFVFHPPLYCVVAYSTMNSNNEEDETTIAVATAVVAVFYTTVPDKEKHDTSVFDQRLCCNRFTELHRHHCIFTCHVRMTLTSFTKLLGYIRDSLLVDSDMASLCGGVIVPEIQLYCTLWYIAGGSYSDIKFFTGISTASFYRVVWRTIRAIVQCKPLSIRFSKTVEEANAGVVIWYLATLGHRSYCFCGDLVLSQ